jgi:magnesium transporter
MSNERGSKVDTPDVGNGHLSDRLRAALKVPLSDASDAGMTTVLREVHPADIAEALRHLTPPEKLAVFNWLDNERAAQVLSDVEPESARYILEHAPSGRIAALLDHLPMDEAAWVVSEATPQRAEVLLSDLSTRAPEDAAEVRELLAYPASSAGRLMTDKFVRLAASLTVEEAFAALRRLDRDVETLNDIYVVDNPEIKNPRLLGVLSLRALVCAPPQAHLGGVMAKELITVTVDTDQEDVARIFSKYDFLAVPVLDRNSALAGIITVDDVIDVLVEESTEDQLRFGAVEPGVITQPYFSTSLWRVVRSRVWWLVLLFVAETATGSVLRHFEDDLAKVVALAFFVPLLIGTGGNTGAQTVSTIIRGLALRDIRLRDTFRVVSRELAGGLLLGAALGVIAFGRALLWGSGFELSLVVALSIVAICTWANTIGAVIPLVAQRVKIDPALVSAPLITTLVDATGLVIYFVIAKMLLSALH